ncbi:MAG: hypothetical protein AB1817_12915 [Chloroflexota bacterium]
MQGRLRGEYLAVTIETECAHCHRPLRLQVDSEMKFQVQDEGAAPLVFVPMVNFARLNEPSIIDAF